jgi:uncharacterized NAD-dependent epimerase/dehydratase family protein
MTASFPEGRAIVYCEGAFGTTNGKTAHGLVRRSARYDLVAVVDSRHAGADAGELLDGRPNEVPVVADLEAALFLSDEPDQQPTHLVVGLAPDGGRLDAAAREDVRRALELGLNVDCGLHDFLAEDPELAALASRRGVRIRDIRRPPERRDLHFFCGKIEQVGCLKVALLGTDSAVGKRTTAWLLVDALNAAGHHAELIGTGQTAWLQGSRYGIVLDSLVNDFVAGEIEHAVWSAWHEQRPEVVVLEGQGSLLNPAYPGGFELLAAGRPDLVVLQHAPTRLEYDGFPGYPLHPLRRQIDAVSMISDRPVVAITLNHEGLTEAQIEPACDAITRETGLPAFDVLQGGAADLVWVLEPWLRHTVVSGRRAVGGDS